MTTTETTPTPPPPAAAKGSALASTLNPGIGKLGPGELTIGETGAAIDVSCLINGARVTATKDVGDSTQKLCGIYRAGNTTYAYELTGNVDVDAGNASGLFALSVRSPGTQHAFRYVPNLDIGTSCSGILVIDPLDFGGDTFGSDLTSDFTFTIVGQPSWTFESDPVGTVS